MAVVKIVAILHEGRAIDARETLSDLDRYDIAVLHH